MKLTKIALKFFTIFLLIFVSLPLTNINVYAMENVNECEINYNVKKFKTLKFELTPPCLNEMFKLDQILSSLEEPINQKTGEDITLENLTYSVIDNGVKLSGNTIIKKPLIGEIDVDFEQDLLIEIVDGILHIKAGENHFNYESSLSLDWLGEIIRKQINQKLSPYNNHTLEYFISNYNSDNFFVKLGVGIASKELILNRLNHINGNINSNQLTFDIPLKV